jgi:hypothetical protein
LLMRLTTSIFTDVKIYYERLDSEPKAK